MGLVGDDARKWSGSTRQYKDVWLDVYVIDHRIGVRDLEWIRTHWPTLHSLHGLF